MLILSSLKLYKTAVREQRHRLLLNCIGVQSRVSNLISEVCLPMSRECIKVGSHLLQRLSSPKLTHQTYIDYETLTGFRNDNLFLRKTTSRS